MTETTRNDGLQQRRRTQTLIGLVFILATAIFVGILYQGLNLDPKAIPSTQVGRPAFEFNAAWIQGKDLLPNAGSQHLTLADLRGRNVVLNFWASWCVSCRDEAVDLEEFWQGYKDQNVMVVGIAIQDTEESAREFAGYFGKHYPLGIDEDGKIAIDYGVTGVPETFFIDENGHVVHKIVGPVDTAMLRDALKYFN